MNFESFARFLIGQKLLSKKLPRLSRLNESTTSLRNDLNNNSRSKFVAYVTVARGCTRDMQQTNYLHGINWNRAGGLRPSFRRRVVLTQRYFNPAFACRKSAGRQTKATRKNCNCSEPRRVSSRSIDESEIAVVTRSGWSLGYHSDIVRIRSAWWFYEKNENKE